MNEGGAYVQAIAHCLGAGHTFVAFREPGRPVQLMVQRTVPLINESLHPNKGNGFVVVPFDPERDGRYWLKPDLQHEFALGSAAFDPARLDGFESRVEVDAPVMFSTTREMHHHLVDEALRAITSGELKKVVVSRTKSIDLERDRTPFLFASLLNEHPDAFVCLISTSEFGLWLGASPERLVSMANGRSKMDALAGTRPLADAELLLSVVGEKERDEQAWVQRDVEETLTMLGMDIVAKIGPEVHIAGPVAHLRTRYEANAAAVALSEIAKALHPTSAVCGTPRDRAREFILQHEQHDRQLYAGYWGPVRSQNEGVLYVNLRCLRSLKEEALLYLGGGITAGSDADREWQETEQKALTLERPIAALKARIS